MRIHHRIVNHVSRHHKKYLFLAWGVFGTCLFKIIIVVGAFFGVTIMTWRSNASYEKHQVIDVIQVMNQINTLAHDFFDGRIKRWEVENLSLTKTFTELDSWFHNAKDLYEKYTWARKMKIFFDEMDRYLHDTHSLTTNEDIEKDRQYHTLKLIFESI